MRHTIFLSLLMASAAIAQDSIGGPMSGIVFDRQARALRPLIGVPGAAYLGSPVVANADYAVAAPGGLWAFSVAEGQGRFWSALRSGNPVVHTLALLENAQKASFSAKARFAVLWNEQAVQRVDLRDNAILAAAAQQSPGEILTAAINDLGAVALATSSGLYYWPADAVSPMLVAEQKHSAVTFANDGRMLYALDRQSILMYDVETAARSSIALSTPSAVNSADATAETTGVEPAGLGVSQDGKLIFVPDTATTQLLIYDSAGVSSTLQLDFAPGGFLQLMPQVFLLNPSFRNREPLMVVDTREQPRIFLIPSISSVE